MCSGLRPLRPAGFIPARPYQSECAAGGRYGALETALGDEAPAGGGQGPALVWRSGGTPCAWLAMAVTIMFGLAFATVLTLIVVPGLYAAFYRIPSPSPA